MPSPKSRREGPDEKRDVIVHYVQIHYVPDGEVRDTWTVFLGLEKQADCNTLEEATTVARDLAKRHGRRAWLNDASGYPLKPIDLAEGGD